MRIFLIAVITLYSSWRGYIFLMCWLDVREIERERYARMQRARLRAYGVGDVSDVGVGAQC